MADYNVSINSKKLDKILARYPRRSKKAIDISLLQSSLEVQNKAKINAPFKTGNLRRSITHVVRRGIANVGTNVVYARVREYNTRSRPKGYLRPALRDSKRKIIQIFERNLSRLLWH